MGCPETPGYFTSISRPPQKNLDRRKNPVKYDDYGVSKKTELFELDNYRLFLVSFYYIYYHFFVLNAQIISCIRVVIHFLGQFWVTILVFLILIENLSSAFPSFATVITNCHKTFYAFFIMFQKQL